MPLFWCLHALWRSSRGSRRWIASGYPPTPGGGGRHRWAGRGRSGGFRSAGSRGRPSLRHLQVGETHEAETSIPQAGWSWTIPRLEPIVVQIYQQLWVLIEVIHQSQIQSQKKAEIENPCKHWVFRLVYAVKTNQPLFSTLISTVHTSTSGSRDDHSRQIHDLKTHGKWDLP